MDTLDIGEVEAVIGHELGHLKHRDVQVMMFVSILPAIFYFIGYSMLLSSMFNRNDSRDSGGAAIIGLASILIYWVLTIFTLYLSRMREYYADRHSALIVENGSQKLSEGLAKIVHSISNMKKMQHRNKDAGGSNSFKALFISDPDRSEIDDAALRQIESGDRKLVEAVLRRKVTTFDKIMEVFSTHPNIIKRLKALQELS
jgi:heat shock protein HtpX